MPFDPTYVTPIQFQQGGKVAVFAPGSLMDHSGLPATGEYMSGANALTAHAGGGQAAALPLTSVINRVTTVATAGDSLLLPGTAALPAGAAIQLTVINASGTSLNVFPAGATQGGIAGGDQINVLGVNTAFAIGGGKTATFYASIAGQWHTILSA